MTEQTEIAGARIGHVKSDKRDKTRTVVVEYQTRHPKYGKYVRKRTVLHVHDEGNESKVGDKVMVAQCRPIVSLALTRSGEAVEVVPGERVRIMSTFIGNERFGAYVTAPAGELPDLVPHAEALMQSLAIATDDSTAPVGTDRFIGSLTRQSDDVVTYHDLLGSAHVSFTTGADLDAAIVVNEPQMVILASPVGDLAFVAYEGLAVDPSIDQSVIVDPSEASSLPRIEPAPSSIDEWVSYADELGEVTATGFADVGGTEVGGTEVPWFEFAVVPGSGFECELGRLGTVECINFLERWWHSSAESKNRHLVFGDVGVMVIVFPSASIDQAMDGWQPLFDTLSIEPVS